MFILIGLLSRNFAQMTSCHWWSQILELTNRPYPRIFPRWGRGYYNNRSPMHALILPSLKAWVESSFERCTTDQRIFFLWVYVCTRTLGLVLDTHSLMEEKHSVFPSEGLNFAVLYPFYVWIVIHSSIHGGEIVAEERCSRGEIPVALKSYRENGSKFSLFIRANGNEIQLEVEPVESRSSFWLDDSFFYSYSFEHILEVEMYLSLRSEAVIDPIMHQTLRYKRVLSVFWKHLTFPMEKQESKLLSLLKDRQNLWCMDRSRCFPKAMPNVNP